MGQAPTLAHPGAPAGSSRNGRAALYIETPEVGHHPLPRTALGAPRLNQRPVRTSLATAPATYPTEVHARSLHKPQEADVFTTWLPSRYRQATPRRTRLRHPTRPQTNESSPQTAEVGLGLHLTFDLQLDHGCVLTRGIFHRAYVGLPRARFRRRAFLARPVVGGQWVNADAGGAVRRTSRGTLSAHQS